MNYGRAIRTLRAARELSQKELAALVAVSPSYISLVESGARIPGPATMASISKAMKVPAFLLSFLASDAEDLRGIGVHDAQELASHLLNVLTSDAG